MAAKAPRTAALAAAAAAAARPAAGFAHGWGTVQEAMWGWTGTNVGDATPAQLAWMARNYPVVVVNNNGRGAAHVNVSAPGQFDTARRLKAANPAVRTLLYEDSVFGALGFGQAELQQHPEWWLRDDSGRAFMKWHKGAPTGQPQTFDFRIQAARDWFARTVDQFGDGAELWDGVLVDTAAAIVRLNRTGHVFSEASMRALTGAKMRMLAETGAFVGRLNGGEVVANPTLPYGIIGDPGRRAAEGWLFPPDYHWRFANGTLDEMFGAFATQDAGTGAWNATRMAASFDAIAEQARGGKTVLVRGYPGPCGTPIDVTVPLDPPPPHGAKALNIPAWPAGWPEAQPADVAGLQSAAAALLRQALAPYLIVAAPTVFFSYAYWYSVQSGWAPCPDAPGTCLAPAGWYPDLARPLGEPAGPARRNGTVWTREFAHATATVDLADRTRSTVVWR